MTITTHEEYQDALDESQRILASFPNDGALDRMCELAMAVMIYETENGINAEPPP